MSVTITAALIEICPAAYVYADGMESACERYDISTPARQAMFLAQCAHESMAFTRTEENLNYSAARLLAVFPRYFDRAMAERYERNPRAIASRVYASRMGNGPESTGDGWLFRGMGLIQLTGKANHSAFSRSFYGDERLLTVGSIVPHPLTVSPLAAVSAGWFWNSMRINEAADAEDLEATTRLINGGLMGLEDRRVWWTKAKEALGINDSGPA